MYLFFLSLLGSLPLLQAAPSCSLVPASLSSQSSASGSPLIPNSTTSNNSSFIAATWYPGWLTSTFSPSQISWDKYSIVTYSFAITTPDVNTLSLADSDESSLPTFVSLAHSNNVLASVSIGGWTGSLYYSTAVGSAENRTAFVQTVLGLVSKYNLDGVDFDWEYPGTQGIGCNSISPNDTANFLSFLQELRSNDAAKNLTLSAATNIRPFTGSDGTPMTDVSEFSKVLSYIAIMNYDINGQWSTTGVGPNAPLNDSCSTVMAGSATSAIAAWTAAKFPANQIVLGVPAYGHSFNVDPSAALSSSGTIAPYPSFIKNSTVVGTDQCGNPENPADGMNFVDLVNQGYLNTNGTATDGIDYRFDNCSQTPYVYDPTTNLMVSYDDPTSFAAKGQFILDNQLAGFAMWDATGDYNDLLLNSIIGSLS